MENFFFDNCQFSHNFPGQLCERIRWLFLTIAPWCYLILRVLCIFESLLRCFQFLWLSFLDNIYLFNFNILNFYPFIYDSHSLYKKFQAYKVHINLVSKRFFHLTYQCWSLSHLLSHFTEI